MDSINYSIIMPVYNNAKYISKAIESVINQYYQNFELIIVNDGSTDNTEKIIKSYRDKRIKYIEQKNSGVSSARNNGLKNAVGKYIMFLDSDDYLSLDALKKIDLIMQNNDIDVLKYNYIIKNGFIKRKYIFSNETDKIINSNDLKEVYDSIFNSYDLNNVWNAVIKKEIAQSVEFDNKKINSEDLEYMCNIILKAKSIYFLKDYLYYYNCNNNSISHSMDIKTSLKKMDDLLNCYEKIKNGLAINSNDFYMRIWNDIVELLLIIVYDSKNYYEYTKFINEINLVKKYYNYIINIDKVVSFNVTEKIYSMSFYKQMKIECFKKKIKILILNIFS